MYGVEVVGYGLEIEFYVVIIFKGEIGILYGVMMDVL